MPQTNVLADWKLTYPNDAPRVKPSAVNGTVTRVPTAMAWATGVVTATVPANTDYVGTVYPITVSGVTPAGYNGTYQGTLASATTITFPLASNPGTVTVQGSISYPGTVPVNMSTTLAGNATPNAGSYTEGHLLTAEEIAASAAYSEPQVEEAEVEEQQEEEQEEEVEEDDDDTPRRGRGRRR